MRKTSKSIENGIGKALYSIAFIIFVLGGIDIFIGISDQSLGLVGIFSSTVSVLMSGSIPLGLSEIIKLISKKTE